MIARFLADFGPRHRHAEVIQADGQYEVLVADESQSVMATVLITRDRDEALRRGRLWADSITQEPAA